mgnify:CR=1 FL=1
MLSTVILKARPALVKNTFDESNLPCFVEIHMSKIKHTEVLPPFHLLFCNIITIWDAREP